MINLAQDTDEWSVLVNTVMKLGSTKDEEFIIQLTNYHLLKNPAPWN
jgi:hypothetical protein